MSANIPDLYPHQLAALRKLSNGKILDGGVGSGKSRVAVEYYKLREAPKHVYVITTARKRDDLDWEREFLRVNIGPLNGPARLRLPQGKTGVRDRSGRVSPDPRGDSLLCRSGVDDGQPGEGTRGVDQAGRGSRSDSTSGRGGLGHGGGPESRTVEGSLGGSHAALSNSTTRGVQERCDELSSSGKNNDGTSDGDAGVAGDGGCTPLEGDRRSEGSQKAPELLGEDDWGSTGGGSGADEPARLGEGSDAGGVVPGDLGVRLSDEAVASERRTDSDDGWSDQISSLGGTYPWVLTVDSWNNINKYAGVEGAFFIFDEQRLVGSGQWSKSFLRISRRNHWILLSATPGDTWMDYVPVFVANGFYKNRSEFKREHVVYSNFTKFPKIDRYINVGRLVRQRTQILVHMPYMRHTERRHVEVPLLYDKEALDLVLKQRWHVYQDRPLRDVGEMFSVARRVVNSDPSRLEMVCELWKKHPRLIVFYNFNYELESLRSLKEYYDLSPMGNGTSTKKASRGNGATTSTPISIDGSGTACSCSGACAVRVENVKTFEAVHGVSNSTRGMTASTRASVVTRGRESSSRKSLDRWKTTPASESSTTAATTICSDTPSKLGIGFERSTKPQPKKSNGISNSRCACGTICCGQSTTRRSRPGSNPLVLPRDTGTLTPSTTSTSLDRGARPSVSIAEWNGHKHEPVPTTDRWLYLVQYTAGSEAWNCTTTDAMIMYSLNYSWKVTEQSEGRIDRLDTPFRDLWYYIFQTDSWIDRAILRSLKAKETFNEGKYKGLMT